jgi:hypothetical protein
MMAIVPFLSTLLLAAAAPSPPKGNTQCSMKDMGNNLWAIEMYSTQTIMPWGEIHCGFSGQDPLLSFNGSDPTGQCSCDRSGGESIACTCKCPGGTSKPNCTWVYYGDMQYVRKTKPCPLTSLRLY